jgi:alpha-glucosidase
MIKKSIFSLFAVLFSLSVAAVTHTISSPDGKLIVTIHDDNGQPTYAVSYAGKQMLTPSALGLRADIGDFTHSLTLKGTEETKIDRTYLMSRTKTSKVHFVANQLQLSYENNEKNAITITFCISNNDVAYRYTLDRPAKGNPKCAVIYGEASSFNFPEKTTTFLSPQAIPMTGWERTKPSYEEEYTADAPLTAKSKYNVGYTFPCLFKIGTDGWVLVSETGVTSKYCGSRLSDYEIGKGYTIAFPQKGENNGMGSEYVGMALPGSTAWRTITVGSTLKPIVETTIPFDVVDPLYIPSISYQPGRYTWSWLIWQDNSVNYADQLQFIDLAAEMGYEYCLVDGLWDKQIGWGKVKELAHYASKKDVKLLLWYNSNGWQNDAPQGPQNIMNNSIRRKQEMAWMKSIGVKGIKVDFFGGDKQETIKLYEDILSDANDYGLQVIFHGCTLPRGWERMYPNYVSSEAALASENVIFTEYHARREGFELTMHSFCRNTVGSFDWGGVILNRYLSRDNKSRHQRFTSDIFELATAIVLQTSINCIALQPNNLKELPDFELDFLRQVPTTWDEVRFLDGYPGRYVVLARRHGDNWYIAGLNGTNKEKQISLDLPMFAGKQVKYYTDTKKKKDELLPPSTLKTLNMGKDGKVRITMQPMGGVILTNN